MEPLAILAIVFGAVAVVLFSVTWVVGRRAQRRLAGTVQVRGTIVKIRGDVEQRRDSDGYGAHSVQVRYPTLVYTDPRTDEEHTFESRVSTTLPIDSTLPLAVRPGEPASAFVSTFSALWIGPLILGTLTAGFSAAAVGLAVGAALS